jgi:hypothetical protein
MFQIQFTELVLNQLPGEKRTEFNRDLQLFWLSSIRDIHQAAYMSGKASHKLASATSQIGSMVRYLQEKMGVVGIYITEPSIEQDSYVYLDQEPYPNIPVFLDSEIAPPAEDVFVYGDGELNPFNFTVWVPESLNSPQELELVNYYISQVALLGLTWNIEIIP